MDEPCPNLLGVLADEQKLRPSFSIRILRYFKYFQKIFLVQLGHGRHNLLGSFVVVTQIQYNQRNYWDPKLKGKLILLRWRMLIPRAFNFRVS